MRMYSFDKFIDELLNEMKSEVRTEKVEEKGDNIIKLLLPGVKQVEIYYLPNEQVIEVETGDSMIDKYKNATFKIGLPTNKKPASAKLDSGVLIIELKDDIKSEKIEVEVL